MRVNPATGAETREQAEVLATNGGVVLKIGQRIEVLRDDGLPVRVIFDKVPDNLRARPTLSVTVIGARAGTRPATLSYLTPDLGWRADYVALYDEADGKIDVQGWITLTNSSGVSYETPNAVGGRLAQPSRRQPAARTTVGRRRRRSTLTASGYGKRQSRASGRLLPVSVGGAHHHRQSADQAGEFPGRSRRPAEHGYEFSQPLAGNHGTRRRAPRASIAFRPARTPAWAINCPRESCGSTCATSAAIRNSSVRAASTTPRWARHSRSPPGMPST